MTSILADRIKQRLADLRISPTAASLKATGARDTLRSILNGSTVSPRVDTLKKIATALETTPEWLMGTVESTAVPLVEVRPVEVPLPPRNAMPADVPVLGTAAGSHIGGAFQIEGGVIDYVRRPPALMGARDIYALYIEGTSMDPHYRPGSLVFVHPHKPPRVGDTIIVQMRNGEHDPVQASIGYFKGRTTTHVIIGKLNPQADVQIVRTVITAVHKVLDTNELFGV